MSGVAEDVEAIKALKARYFRLLDTKDWAGFRQLFTDDVAIDTSAAGGSVTTSADEFVAFLVDVLADAVTVHQGHMPEIELTGPDSATGVWALHDIVVFPTDLRLDGFGHYHETYERIGGEWLIK
ncbi:MAG TPA: nuclear transport factor 2 family protein, partial [Acidimicrobiales bacterium]|nr:nuclear transport factor 2 family protein [Acidimicrobiales bacterium]